MSWCKKIFGTNKPIIGMVHLKALPGTANFDGDMEKIYAAALKDAKALEAGGVNGIMVENDGDIPFSHLLTTEQTAALAALTAVIKEHTNVPIGVDAAFCDYKSGLACAKGARADFIRLPVFVDTVVSFNGIMEACCDEALKYRKAIDATEVKILADVQVKYTHMLNSNISLEESAVWAQACGADGVIVTGSHTGGETPIDAVKRVKNTVKIPVFIGSGVTTDNADEQLNIADGAIVGSSIKSDGVIDTEKVKKLMNKIEHK
ncbi:phosphoribosylanthranilate isomerase [Vallitalea longa]|uniref:Phosphoribosylanthranilate isomerase n=1 Tax=Vallitalea longa TaxID=2936439 RepID=A0A9W5YA89_9FIRM|nr:BtpA/SgcQ family protein [Vallitalea longa]GKX30220.1 phosphoribosylanthranilate isomerase [Vallitalea longa]